jgi:hypothetical protein
MVTTERLQLEALQIWVDRNRSLLPMFVRVALDSIASGRPDIWATIPEMAKLDDDDRVEWAEGARTAAYAMRFAAQDLRAPVPSAAQRVLASVPK